MSTILVVDDHIPEHDVHAGALTVLHYLEIMRGEGRGVAFHPDDGVRGEPYAGRLERLGIRVLDSDADTEHWLEANGRRLDVAMLSRPHVARRWLRSVRRSSDARVLYLAHDLHHVRERRRFDATADPDALSESRRLLEIEQQLFREVDVVLTFSPDEVPTITALAPAADVRVVAPAFYAVSGAALGPRPARPPFDDRHDVVFVGAFDHLPNVDAALVLVEDVMPLVWASFPGCRAILIGDHVPARVSALASDRVEVTGHVASLDPYWARARLSVAPLRFGSGVKGQIIASLEAEVPVVTTAIGNEGIGLRDGSEVLLGETPTQLADAVMSLLADAELARSLAEAGAAVLEQRFSEDRVRRDLLAALEARPR
jgi:glycosyltransferase involved in cell wall biosynthesis